MSCGCQFRIFLWPVTSRIPSSAAHPSAAIFFFFKFKSLQPPICCCCCLSRGQQELITRVPATSFASRPPSGPEVRDLEKSPVTYEDRQDDWIMNQLGGLDQYEGPADLLLPAWGHNWLINTRLDHLLNPIVLPPTGYCPISNTTHCSPKTLITNVLLVICSLTTGKWPI